MSSDRGPRIVLVRHGETEWSASGRHTGRTDVPLTDDGFDEAELLKMRLAGERFALVLTSPLRRALDTCTAAGLGEQAQRFDELMEWDYGAYEGLTTAQIREQRPGWSLFRDGCPEGETAIDVGRRADVAIERLREAGGDAVAFAHGHILRTIGARWLGWGPEQGAGLGLSTAAVCTLGYERETPVLWSWNETGHLGGSTVIR